MCLHAKVPISDDLWQQAAFLQVLRLHPDVCLASCSCLDCLCCPSGFSTSNLALCQIGRHFANFQPLALHSADHSQCFICQINPNTFPNYIAAPKCRYWKISQRLRPHLWRCWGAWAVHYGFMRITQRWHSGRWAGKHVVMRFKCSITTAVQAMLGCEHKMLLSTLHMLESSRQKRRISSGLTSSLVP